MEQTMNRIYGEFFGYPDCCITAFGDVAVPFFMRPDISKRATVNGFVPCPECARKIHNGEITHEELINPRRKCSVPFKQGHPTEAEELQIQTELMEL